MPTRYKTVVVVTIVLFLVTGCGKPEPTSVPLSPTAVPVLHVTKPVSALHTPSPTVTPTSTETPLPTATLTATLVPTRTPRPTATATLVSTHTPRPTATATFAPTPTSTPWSPPSVSGKPITVCATGCDFATVQAAIDDADTQPEDVIYIADAVHTEAGITIAKDITIQGQGAQDTIVQAHQEAGKATDRVFFVAEGATVTIQAMTIRHGSPTEGLRSGGGIENDGVLTLADSIVSDNLANCGGGIWNNGGMLMVVNCTIRDNIADGVAAPGYDCGSGGAIKNVEGGTLTVINSTLSHNHAQGKGGGLHVSCKSTATLTNCTISDNHAEGRGGGIHFKGVVTLNHCTIAGNSAKGVVRGEGIGDPAGGGISIRGGTLHFSNTIIANNPQDGDCFLGGSGAIVTNVHNLIGDGSCPSDYSGDPNLGPLADNGGGTQTRALLPGSPAIDATPARDCISNTDQRGEARPVVQTSPDTPCDIGAFELQ
jgi:predicted outer membrane repeat protein